VNTDTLIELLSANVQPVGRGRFERALLLSVAMSGMAAFGVMLVTLGPRYDLGSPPHLAWSGMKLLFALSVVGVTMPVLIRSARPGPRSVTGALPVLVPFVAVGVAALAERLLGSPELWRAMLRGATTLSPARCLLCIIGFSAIPLVVLIRALRDGAPTRPSVCGALAGLVAGGVGAAAYALACNSDSVPFIAVWYSAAIALYGALGALLGSRLLRW